MARNSSGRREQELNLDSRLLRGETVLAEAGNVLTDRSRRHLVLASLLLLMVGACGSQLLSGNEASMSNSEVNSLPANWRYLDTSEKFAALRDSPNLVRGSMLPDVEIDCRKRKIRDLNAQFELKVNYPTREDGSFTFLDRQNRLVTGRLVVLRSDARQNDRIFVLSRPFTFENGSSVPYVLRRHELSHVASLLETLHNHCWPAQANHHIDVYVIVVKQER